VADAGNSVIVKIPAGGGAPVTLGSGFLSPFGVAVDGHGNVYVADKGNNAVKEIPVDSSAVMTLGSGFSGPKGVWADAMGNVYVADAGHSAIKEIPAGGGSIVTIGNAVARPGALTVNGAGIVFVTDETGGVVESVTPVGGYYIDKVLPEGLVFGPYEGTIGGTPLKISPATNYVVTYYSPYFSGSASATLNIKVTSGNVYLYAIKMSSGTLSPAFAYNVDNYTDSVTSAQSSIMVKPIPSDSLATITVNGSPVSAKMSSPPIPLNAGLNNITIKVTAQDGTTTGTYTVAVIRGAGPLNTPEADASFNQDSKAPVGDGDIVIVHPGVTPNGDGKNDFLAIDGLLAYPDNKLTIMNRNGAVIFEAKGYGNASKVFDGHSSKTGQMQLPGTYFYSLEYTANGIARHKTGFLVLKY
jgi:gliding motility-associated-like protein